MFYSPANYETFESAMDEGGVGWSSNDENILEAIPGSVDAVFILNNDAELSVPVSYLNSIMHTQVQMSRSLQATNSYYLTKPPLRVPEMNVASFAANQYNGGSMEGYEVDLYNKSDTGEEDCD